MRLVALDVTARPNRVQHSGLESTEREVIEIRVARLVVSANHRLAESEAGRIALACELFDRAATGVGQAQQLCDLVERFSGRIVPRRAKHPVPAPLFDVQKQRMTTGHQQPCERGNGIAVFERCREEMPFHMVYADHRNAAGERERLRVAHTHEQCANQSWSRGHRNRVDIADIEGGITQSLVDYGNDARQVCTRGDFRNDPAKNLVNILRQNDQRSKVYFVASSVEHRSRRLIAGRLDSENSSQLLRLLRQQSLDQRAVLRRIPVVSAEQLFADYPIAADDYGFGIAGRLVVATDLAELSLWIAKYLERETEVLREAQHRRIGPGIVNADGDDLESLRAEVLVKLLDARHLDPTRCAPRRPQVDHQDLAAVVIERFLAGRVAERDRQSVV